MLYSQLRTTWNCNNDEDLTSWIGDQPCMEKDFWQFARNNTYVSIPGKLSEILLHAWLFSNLWGKIIFLFLKYGRDLSPRFDALKEILPWISKHQYIHMAFQQFSRNVDLFVVSGKLSEIHYHDRLFPNPQGEVLITVKMSCNPDQRVQLIHTLRYMLTHRLQMNNQKCRSDKLPALWMQPLVVKPTGKVQMWIWHILLMEGRNEGSLLWEGVGAPRDSGRISCKN